MKKWLVGSAMLLIIIAFVSTSAYIKTSARLKQVKEENKRLKFDVQAYEERRESAQKKVNTLEEEKKVLEAEIKTLKEARLRPQPMGRDSEAVTKVGEQKPGTLRYNGLYKNKQDGTHLRFYSEGRVFMKEGAHLKLKVIHDSLVPSGHKYRVDLMENKVEFKVGGTLYSGTIWKNSIVFSTLVPTTGIREKNMSYEFIHSPLIKPIFLSQEVSSDGLLSFTIPTNVSNAIVQGNIFLELTYSTADDVYATVSKDLFYYIPHARDTEFYVFDERELPLWKEARTLSSESYLFKYSPPEPKIITWRRATPSFPYGRRHFQLTLPSGRTYYMALNPADISHTISLHALYYYE